MKTKHFFIPAVAIVLFTGMLFTGCSKGDKPSDSKNMKFTISTTGVGGGASASGGDDVKFILAGGSLSGTQTIWKINGAVRNNEPGISLTEADFAGGTKTFEIESVVPLSSASVSIRAIKGTNTSTPFTISYKATVNGDVKHNDQNIPVTASASYLKPNYSY